MISYSAGARGKMAMDLELVNQDDQIWRFREGDLPLSELPDRLTVGGVAWKKVERQPAQGEWCVTEVPWYPGGVAIKLGSPPLHGWAVECGARDTHDAWRDANYAWFLAQG